MKKMVNASKMNHMEIENTKNLMEIGMLIQKLSKGRRKYSVNLNSASRKLLYKTMSEMKTIISQEGVVPKNFSDFVSYINDNIKSKSNLSFSFDEINFLKKVISLTLQQQDSMKYKWYQLPLKIMANILQKQYKNILVDLKI